MARGATNEAIADIFGARLRAQEPTLTKSTLRVARFIDANRATTLASSAAELAAAVGTSDATVIRAVQALGFDSLADLRQLLAATLDRRSTVAENMSRTLADVGDSAGRAVDHVIETHRESIQALQSKAGRATILLAVAKLHPAHRIVVFGIGPSGALARYLALLLTRNGRQALALDATGIALADQLLDLREGDALLILAYGRSYREVVATFAEARRLGLPIVLVSDTLDSRVARHADVVVPARRGRAERVSLHGTTLVALEAIVLGLAASDRGRAVGSLERLNELRESVNGKRADIG